MKKIFANTTPITPADLNVLQNPHWVNLADYPANTTNLDLDPGIYFVPPINVAKNLTGFPGDGEVYLDGTGVLSDPWGGRVFTATETQLTAASYVTPPGFITLWVTQGKIISTAGEVVGWNAQFVDILNNTTSYIYSDDTGFLHINSVLPTRNTPRVGLAKITFINTSVYTIEDIRPANKVGSRDDLQLYLVNTNTKTDNYRSVTNDRVLCNSTTQSFVVTLPENPSDNDRIGLVDVVGSFAANPVVLASPLNETSPGIFVPAQSIGGQAQSWQFSVPRTNVSLVYSSERNDWLFEETPNDACAGQIGQFLRCGGAVPGITQEVNCLPPNTWDDTKLLCRRPSTAATYSDGTEQQAMQYVEYNAVRCGAVFEGAFTTVLTPFELLIELSADTLTNSPNLPDPYRILSYTIFNEENENITADIYSKVTDNYLVLGSVREITVRILVVGA